MNSRLFKPQIIIVCLFFSLFFVNSAIGQDSITKPQNNFWEKVRFGGGLGLSSSNNFFTLGVSPSAIYQHNPYIATGVALNYTYNKFDNQYKSHIYGGSILGLFNPIREVQLSAELEQLRVNRRFEGALRDLRDDNYWSPALFLGAGYSTNNVTIGLRYNVLFDNSRSVYADAIVPFVRVFF